MDIESVEETDAPAVKSVGSDKDACKAPPSATNAPAVEGVGRSCDKDTRKAPPSAKTGQVRSEVKKIEQRTSRRTSAEQVRFKVKPAGYAFNTL